ncbi:hypothetical protein EON83_20730 [bacterium]|nr:MAG: hypothetical protein EON83_20730 [bacterium]
MDSILNPLPSQQKKALRGSRKRCLDFTEGTNEEVAKRLMELVAPYAQVAPHNHQWMPKGHGNPAEAKLGQALLFLDTEKRKELTKWWLAGKGGANTPNWDIASRAIIDGKEGLILVEAKAHEREFSKSGKPQKANPSHDSTENQKRISAAIDEANRELNALMPGWGLSIDSHYQLTNRFTWAWKIASLGVPVILVYLGFLEATEMEDCGRPLKDAADWEQVVLARSIGIVPRNAW